MQSAQVSVRGGLDPATLDTNFSSTCWESLKSSRASTRRRLFNSSRPRITALWVRKNLGRGNDQQCCRVVSGQRQDEPVTYDDKTW